MTARAVGIAAAAAVAAVLLAGCGGRGVAPHSGHQLTGSITVPAATPTPGLTSKPSPSPTGAPVCRAAKGYTDIRRGARVLVRDSDGKTLARGELAGGTPVPDKTARCRFRFAVAGLPETPVYAVKVALREPVRYGFSDLDSGGWQVSLAIG